jgi:hypothetical protein
MHIISIWLSPKLCGCPSESFARQKSLSVTEFLYLFGRGRNLVPGFKYEWSISDVEVHTVKQDKLQLQ